jgi:DNA-binding transcriptional ArsR family regulator
MPGVSSPTDQRIRHQLAHVGEAVGDASRAAMLVALMGGVFLPATELARRAGVSPPTATSHLRRLLDAGLVVVRPQGRHRYFALAGPHVAAALEGLATLGLRADLRRPPLRDALCVARTCYSHLAGRLAVTFWTRAAAARWVHWTDTAVSLLPDGAAALARHGLLRDAPAALAGGTCLDWSERVPHVSGRLGIAFCDELLAKGWVKRVPGGRTLRVTARGHDGFASLGVRWAA